MTRGTVPRASRRVAGGTAVFEAFILGALSQSSLVLSGLVVYLARVPRRVVGSLAGFGAGSLIGAIAFDLLPGEETLDPIIAAAWLLGGAATFVVADRVLERLTTRPGAAESSSGGPMGIVVGSIVDGVPESVIFGISIASGQPVSIAFLAAVWVSNIPQALAPSAELAESGWRPARMAAMWSGVVIACGAASVVGYVASMVDPAATGAIAAAFASGGLIAMLTNSLIPFSYERAGAMAGIWAVVGFALALAAA